MLNDRTGDYSRAWYVHHRPERKELSDQHRALLMLGVVEGFTCREIAEILDVPIGMVMSRLSRARQALRARFVPADSIAARVRLAAVSAGREVREMH